MRISERCVHLALASTETVQGLERKTPVEGWEDESCSLHPADCSDAFYIPLQGMTLRLKPLLVITMAGLQTRTKKVHLSSHSFSFLIKNIN